VVLYHIFKELKEEGGYPPPGLFVGISLEAEMKINFKDWWAKIFSPRLREFGSRPTYARMPTAMHNGAGGMGITRASHEESKAARVMSARSRRINRGGSKRK